MTPEELAALKARCVGYQRDRKAWYSDWLGDIEALLVEVERLREALGWLLDYHGSFEVYLAIHGIVPTEEAQVKGHEIRVLLEEAEHGA